MQTIVAKGLWISPSVGRVTLCAINAVTGRCRSVVTGKNAVVYTGLDLLGKLLAGQGQAPNVVYLEFRNGGTTPSITVDPAAGRDYYAGLEVAGNDSDYLRVPLMATPVMASSDDTKFLTNKVTFSVISAGAVTGQGGKEFSSTAISKVYGVALVSAPDFSDVSQDIVFSRSYDFTPVTKQLNEEVTITWSHTFGEEMLQSS